MVGFEETLYARIIEVTGAPGSGKTTFINSAFANSTVLMAGMPLSFGAFRRILSSIFLPCHAIMAGAINIKQIWWLLRKSIKYDELFLAKLNALRNALIKFSYRYFFSQTMPSVIIDEGISHIPFILGLDERDLNEFVILFSRQLAKIKIVFVNPPPKEILIERIITRGHKRVRHALEAEAFVEENCRIAAQYRKVLMYSGFDVAFISTDSIIDSSK